MSHKTCQTATMGRDVRNRFTNHTRRHTEPGAERGQREMDRRQHPRFACFEEVNFVVHDVTHSGIMLNFSKGGFFIMTSLSPSLDPGQSIGLNYYSRTSQSSIHLDCKIIRKETTGIGVMIQPDLN